MKAFSYRVVEPNDDYRQSKLEKSGITATFTFAEVEEHEATLATFKKEREAEVAVEKAKMENIRHFHPIVDTLNGQQLTAAALFKESKTIVDKNTAKLKEIEEALAEYAEEKGFIMKQLGFVPTIIPNSDDNGKETVAA